MHTFESPQGQPEHHITPMPRLIHNIEAVYTPEIQDGQDPLTKDDVVTAIEITNSMPDTFFGFQAPLEYSSTSRIFQKRDPSKHIITRRGREGTSMLDRKAVQDALNYLATRPASPEFID